MTEAAVTTATETPNADQSTPAAQPPAPAAEPNLLFDGNATDAVAGEAPAEAKPEEAKAEAPVVPEKYEFKLPEGYALDEALVGEFTPIAKELELSNDKAQKLVEFYTKAEEARAAKAEKEHSEMVSQWVKNAKADPEIGGANLDATIKSAQRALAAFGSESLKQLLSTTGLSNHPEVIRAFAKAGQHLREDKLVVSEAANAPRSYAERLYGGKK